MDNLLRFNFFPRNDLGKIENRLCSYFCGEITDVLSEKLQILLLDHHQGIVLLMGLCKPVLGIRKGATVVIRNSHVCEVSCRGKVCIFGLPLFILVIVKRIASLFKF